MGRERWDVFVSCGHEDAVWVRALAENLHRDGFDVFLDEWELVGGDRVTGRLEAGIRGSRSGVLVVSPHALSRGWVQEEYATLLDAAVRDPSRQLIAVLYRDAELPPFLASRKWVDFRAATTGPPYDTALDELERYLRNLPAADRPDRGGAREWPLGASGERVRPAGPLAAVAGARRWRGERVRCGWRAGAGSPGAVRAGQRARGGRRARARPESEDRPPAGRSAAHDAGRQRLDATYPMWRLNMYIEGCDMDT